ncbi:MAG: PEP-CTERM sorting domain-containing protein [Desulfatitalea sp.]|nr:PEP-CTERM sorting domain-containing protein [Desulfatitalea sp.]NNK01251.1 PEP-CTERM sorting domain-containing protein [Desulfatitalea sp.]
MKKLSVFRVTPLSIVLCLFGMLCVNPSAFALIIASGDNTPAFYAAYNDNNVFFENILQGGTNVLVHEAATSSIGNNLNTYYNSLTSVSSSYLGSAEVTNSFLSGTDLFVTGMYGGEFTASELIALDSFVDSGGTVFFMGDYNYSPVGINNALAYLGSSMMLYGPISDTGNNNATGSSIASDPFTTGVSSFTYGATNGVSGGTSLFFDRADRPFLAYDGGPSAVPEPSTMFLLGTGLVGLVGIGRKKRQK